MSKSFFVYNFGCRVNMAETLEIRSEMLEAGYEESEDQPDIILINSCAVTQKAEKEVLQFIRSKRKEFPKAKIIVTGCAAVKWEGRKVPINIEKIGKKKIDSGKNIYEESGRTLIKIQDGCDQFCSYCIVPYLRGKPKSKKIKEIIREIRNIEVIREIILTAINTDLFGSDNGENLTDLIKKILDETEIERLSFGSINQNSINDDLVKVFQSPRIVKYFHIPIQSGSDKILELMNRNYKVEEIRGKLEEVKKLDPLTFIGTDIIVGFPGETEENFQETYKFLEQSSISRFHIFRFSKREGTLGWNLENKLGAVPESVKKSRSKELEDLGKRKYQIFLEKHIGKTFKALFLVKKEGKYQEVLLENNVPAWIETQKDFKGQIIEVSIENLRNRRLFGQVPS
ncbi:hypothetical protein COT44_02435 [Candidatus Shapirobacteria bacterium CG08_land_8_20_14_0_20_39_18]|uniref:Uncharacterized protein n=1 Tax=Candidatus Shapirobacteria bacterium CG08_land_8_20_14_0_20_39_18 TaxID=1974883 RepID=A0A2M6XD75_9BACT|nr:MAG: hypothetical protein COT44_02435 [Candidatus Shapirobacteria bacterium CG08_land_8_20_14_0_20_39_18]